MSTQRGLSPLGPLRRFSPTVIGGECVGEYRLDPPTTPDIDPALRAAAPSVKYALESLREAQEVFVAMYGEESDALWSAMRTLTEEFGEYVKEMK